MRAMVLHWAHERLVMEERPEPSPGRGQVRVRVEACGVCRTDLHVVDGELPNPKLPIVPGHEIVGRVEAIGEGVDLKPGARVGVAWLGHTDGTCPYCRSGRENLCDAPLFTGYTRDGGYATHTIAEADFVFPLSEDLDPIEAAPLLCAGLIGWRSLKLAGDGRTIGVYGFGAAGHIIAQVCPATMPVRRLRARSASTGLAGRMTRRPNRSTQQFFSRRLARLFPPRLAR
jgi:alcohol dehydrogenase, propanol-preferring